MEFFVPSLLADTQNRGHTTKKRNREKEHKVATIKKQKKRSVTSWSKLCADVELCIITYLDVKSTCHLLSAIQKSHKQMLSAIQKSYKQRSVTLLQNIKMKCKYISILKTIPVRNVASLYFWKAMITRNKINVNSTHVKCVLCLRVQQSNQVCSNTGLVVCTDCSLIEFRTAYSLKTFYSQSTIDTVGTWIMLDGGEKRFAAYDIAMLTPRLQNLRVFFPSMDDYMKSLVHCTGNVGKLRYEKTSFLDLGNSYMEMKYYPLPFKLTEEQTNFIKHQTELPYCREKHGIIDYKTETKLRDDYKDSVMQKFMDYHIFYESTRYVNMFTPTKRVWYLTSFHAFCRVMSNNIPPIKEGWSFFVET
jgi:hypothetical protein